MGCVSGLLSGLLSECEYVVSCSYIDIAIGKGIRMHV